MFDKSHFLKYSFVLFILNKYFELNDYDLISSLSKQCCINEMYVRNPKLNPHLF